MLWVDCSDLDAGPRIELVAPLATVALPKLVTLEALECILRETEMRPAIVTVGMTVSTSTCRPPPEQAENPRRFTSDDIARLWKLDAAIDGDFVIVIGGIMGVESPGIVMQTPWERLALVTEKPVKMRLGYRDCLQSFSPRPKRLSIRVTHVGISLWS